MLLAEIFGPDVLIVLGMIALLFGGSQLPKLARSLGSASSEFKKGISEGALPEPVAPTTPVVAAPPVAVPSEAS